MSVAETPFPLKTLIASGFGRKFEATIPGGYQAWFLAGATTKAPRVLDAAGKAVKLDLKADEVSASAVGTHVVLPRRRPRDAVGSDGRTGRQHLAVRAEPGWLARGVEVPGVEGTAKGRVHAQSVGVAEGRTTRS